MSAFPIRQVAQLRRAAFSDGGRVWLVDEGGARGRYAGVTPCKMHRWFVCAVTSYHVLLRCAAAARAAQGVGPLPRAVRRPVRYAIEPPRRRVAPMRHCGNALQVRAQVPVRPLGVAFLPLAPRVAVPAARYAIELTRSCVASVHRAALCRICAMPLQVPPLAHCVRHAARAGGVRLSTFLIWRPPGQLLPSFLRASSRAPSRPRQVVGTLLWECPLPPPGHVAVRPARVELAVS